MEQTKVEVARKAAAAIAAAEQQKRDEEERERRLAEQEEFARQMRMRKLMEEQRVAKRQAELSRVALQNQMKLLKLPKSARDRKDSKENSDKGISPRGAMSNEEEIFQQVSWSNLPIKKQIGNKKSVEPIKETQP